MTVLLRAALQLRVSTARQAGHDVSIPDRKRQGAAYCAARGYQVIETYLEPGAFAPNDRRPESPQFAAALKNASPCRPRTADEGHQMLPAFPVQREP